MGWSVWWSHVPDDGEAVRTPPEHVQVEIAVQLLNAWMLLKVPEIEDMIPNRWGRTPESSSA